MKNCLIIFFTIFLISCSSSPENQAMQIQLADLHYKQDMNTIPNYNLSYTPNEVNFLKRYFSVYNQQNIKTQKNDALWAINGYKNGKKISYYSPSRRKIADSWFNSIKEAANTNSYLKVRKYAVTIDNVELRNAPTNEPIFKHFGLAGEGYPFDHYANSTLSIAYPLFVSHYSKNRDFVFVSNDAVWGWIDARKVKILTQDEAKELESSRFFTVLKDRVPIHDIQGNFLFQARVGAILPYEFYENGYFIGQIDTVLGRKTFKIKDTDLSTWPANFDQKTVKEVIGSVLGEPYGWGGFGFYRDCSLFLKDYFATFGIWLPRNSLSQSKIGEKFDLKSMDNKTKKEFIIKHAKPYETILYMPGHVMLYVGHNKGDIITVHDAWGIRTKDNQRVLISSIAITSAEIGKELKNVETKDLLLSKVTSMNIVTK